MVFQSPTIAHTFLRDDQRPRFVQKFLPSRVGKKTSAPFGAIVQTFIFPDADEWYGERQTIQELEERVVNLGAALGVTIHPFHTNFDGELLE